MDYLSYLQNPDVPQEDKIRLVNHLQHGSEKTDWGTTSAALAADMGLGLLGEHIINKKFGDLGNEWSWLGKDELKRKARAGIFRNGLGMFGGAMAGLAAAPLYKHLANYLNPYGNEEA